jgi:hypothetical protein
MKKENSELEENENWKECLADWVGLSLFVAIIISGVLVFIYLTRCE